MSNTNLYNDYDKTYIVMEQTTPVDSKIEIQKVVESNGLNFVRFSTCLQDFNGYNRNRRKWPADIVRAMAEAPTVQELIKRNSFVGEAGHPVPDSGQVTMERICNIDPLKTSHRFTKLFWPKPNELHGICETLDEGVGSPGYRMMRNILQGVVPAFSLRSLVPQRKNADGSKDVIGVGRMICYDRVYLPSHESAYMDVDMPVSQVVTKPEFNVVMESFTDHVMSHSDKIRSIIDDMEPALESACYDAKTGLVSVKTEEGRVFIAPEMKYRKEIHSALENLNLF